MKFDIDKIDNKYIEMSCKKWDLVAKPIDGLGRLEKLINTIAAVKRNTKFSLDKRAMIIFCADNGVVAEGVTQTDNSVTKLVAENIAKGNATIAVLSKVARADAVAVDMGIDCDDSLFGVIDCKIAKGTKNIAREAAMSRKQCEETIQKGVDVIKRFSDYDIIGIGEMGIGNTTTTAAVASVLLDIEPREAVGRGAGLDDAGLERKIRAVESAVRINKPNKSDVIDVLSKLGGYDICGMVGAYIGCAMCHIPVIADGVIGLCAAYAAVKLCPEVLDYILPSHKGKEPLCAELCKRLGFEPVITADMALGEGSGAVMLLPLLDMALSIYNNSTFEALSMDAYERMK